MQTQFIVLLDNHFHLLFELEVTLSKSVNDPPILVSFTSFQWRKDEGGGEVIIPREERLGLPVDNFLELVLNMVGSIKLSHWSYDPKCFHEVKKIIRNWFHEKHEFQSSGIRDVAILSPNISPLAGEHYHIEAEF